MRKLRCDGLKPRCSSCTHRCKECHYRSGGVWVAPRTPVVAALEARVLELERTVHRLTLSSAHNLSLASARLAERIERLGSAPKWRRFPDASRGFLEKDPATRDPYAIQTAIEQELLSCNLAEFEELPLSLSINLMREQWRWLDDIRILLPPADSLFPPTIPYVCRPANSFPMASFATSQGRGRGR
ncbi:hypothetical protein DL93DRAFT_1796584 [Clavulina sp. PMI_390]|nr:hypothetical protein DL93DRAFT_1796584 [Clavulina sp. PMI_390]